MKGKKKLLASVAALSGATRVMESRKGTPSLMILNYHRIGNAHETPYDPNLFSCTQSEFDWQIAYVARRFPVLSLQQACEAVLDTRTLDRPSVLITFDDGYRDNFELAFPVLQRHQVSGTFFLPTAFVGTGKVPWWDSIAYILKNSRHARITLEHPVQRSFDLAPENITRAIQEVLTLFKQPIVKDQAAFIAQLEDACDCRRPSDDAGRHFLSFDEARQMQAAGMCFGSHTHSHELLAKLPYSRQVEEFQTSRQILEKELDREIDTLAYPVGSAEAFSNESKAALAACNYRVAFSFKGGVNKPGSIDPLDVQRVAMDEPDRNQVRLRLALLASKGISII